MFQFASQADRTSVDTKIIAAALLGYYFYFIFYF